MEFLTIVLIYVIQGVIFGFITKYIANSKGYDSGFAWGFWLGIIGVLVVGFRPTINQASNTQTYQPMYPNAQPKPKAQWECGCGAMNPDSLNYCLSCRRNRGEYRPAPKINCPHCGAINKETNVVCFACNQPLKETALPAAEEIAKPVTPAAPVSDSGDFVSLLEKLAKLHEQGILTDEEFQQKKSDILAKM